jgi:hypothetical protein
MRFTFMIKCALHVLYLYLYNYLLMGRAQVQIFKRTIIILAIYHLKHYSYDSNSVSTLFQRNLLSGKHRQPGLLNMRVPRSCVNLLLTM